ncbi:hypothetical protein GH714_030675 [Hevea brasiliensis]|uniref:Uncharacterized protein n=1 Tax=Hevea brasiliensis TaxID=3981 RepID=A0A6A6LXJ7_HEVBR|nr:hypothetical protein GH714_030675 [Hevea brasiliensis]
MHLYCKRKTPEDEQLGARLVLALEAALVMYQPSSVAASGLRAVEENDGGEGCSLDGMHLYCKRRAPEDEQLGARCVLALEAAPIMHQPSSVVASGLGAGVGPSNIHQTIGVAGEAQHSQRNICLRRAPEDEQLGLLFKPTASCIDQNPFANDPSNSSSLTISSGITEHMVEENDGGKGFSIDGKHLYCKRRAPEDEQLGVGLVLALETASIMHQPSSVAASVLGAGAGPSNIHQTIGVAGETQHSQRNIRLRRAPEDEQLGCSLDGRRLYYKRRAPEDEQLGARLVLALETAPIMHQPLSVAVSRLGAGVGPSNIYQTIGVAGEAQHSYRNIRLRRAPKDNSLVISSGIAEYIVEENDGGEGCSLNGRHLYYKKRAPKDKQLDAGCVLALEAAPVMHQPSSFAASGLGVEYIVKENDGGEGYSLDGMRLYYKRRAPEDEQLGARCVLALEAAPIMHQLSSVVASGLRAGVGPSDIHQTIGVAGEA